MSDLVGNPEDRFSRVAARFMSVMCFPQLDHGVRCLAQDGCCRFLIFFFFFRLTSTLHVGYSHLLLQKHNGFQENSLFLENNISIFEKLVLVTFIFPCTYTCTC